MTDMSVAWHLSVRWPEVHEVSTTLTGDPFDDVTAELLSSR